MKKVFALVLISQALNACMTQRDQSLWQEMKSEWNKHSEEQPSAPAVVETAPEAKAP